MEELPNFTKMIRGAIEDIVTDETDIVGHITRRMESETLLDDHQAFSKQHVRLLLDS